MDETVTITLYRFENLLGKSNKYDMLIKKMIETSALSGLTDWLTFSGSELSDIIRLFEPVLYEERIHDLKIKDKNINKED